MYSKKFLLPLLFALLVSCTFNKPNDAGLDASLKSNSDTLLNKVVLVVHGGAGTILKSQMTPERENAYKNAIKQALQAGYDTLQQGGTSLDAVEAAIRILEDNPLFNAGKGAVFTHAGTNELDASIMDGNTLKAGAVAGVTNIKHPVSAARAVMEQSEHVMLSGSGAEEFAAKVGLEIVNPAYFFTEKRWKSLLRVREREKNELDNADTSAYNFQFDTKFGTVGACALDKYGNLAAATSTGGMTNKRFGRIGDSPIIGAGTYADNSTCAISCTGWGEFFIRAVAAHDIAARMKYKQISLDSAAEEVIMQKIPQMGGTGGMIGLDKNGNAVMKFNTSGMYRGYITAEGEIKVFIYKND